MTRELSANHSMITATRFSSLSSSTSFVMVMYPAYFWMFHFRRPNSGVPTAGILPPSPTGEKPDTLERFWNVSWPDNVFFTA